MVTKTSRQKSPQRYTIYHVGSLTKAFTAAGLAIMFEEGEFKLDALLKDVIPGFHQLNENVQMQATIVAPQNELAMIMNY